MALFAPFKSATGASKTPDYVQAEIARANFEQAAKDQKNAQRQQNVTGAVDLYGQAAGENTPIADYMSSFSQAPIDQAAAQTTGTITPAGSETAAALRTAQQAEEAAAAAQTAQTATATAEGTEAAVGGSNPWTLLAAAIMANETSALEGGYRDADDKDYAKDVFGGKVVEQDVSKHWLPKVFGEDLENDVTGLGGDSLMGVELATGDFSNAWDALKEDSTIAKLLRGFS